MGVFMFVRLAAPAAVVLAVLALAVAGCGGDDDESPAPPAEQTQSTPEAEQPSAEEHDGESEEEREREERQAGEVSSKACSEIEDDLDGKPENAPPKDLSVPEYAHVYKSEGPFGKTERFYAVLDGTAEELASRRDDAQNYLVQNSQYASLSTDEEDGFEAEAHLERDESTVDIQVTPLCEGKLRIRYTVS
jgi:hypothetical protein